jgi:hypothetical protein
MQYYKEVKMKKKMTKSTHQRANILLTSYF